MSVVDDMLRGLAVLFVVGMAAMGGAYVASAAFSDPVAPVTPAPAQAVAREARNVAAPVARGKSPRGGNGREGKGGQRSPRSR